MRSGRYALVMAQVRYHAERAFEQYLRWKRVPYVAVHEARQALIPPGDCARGDGHASLKSFDFVVYGTGRNLLVEVKGRRLRVPVRAELGAGSAGGAGMHRHTRVPLRRPPRLESWATLRDVEDLLKWEALFGEGFEAAVVFVYACSEQPPDGVFEEVFGFEEQWYALRTVTVSAYARAMKVRSQRWGTVDLHRSDFERLSGPLGAGMEAGGMGAGGPGGAGLGGESGFAWATDGGLGGVGVACEQEWPGRVGGSSQLEPGPLRT